MFVSLLLRTCSWIIQFHKIGLSDLGSQISQIQIRYISNTMPLKDGLTKVPKIGLKID